MPWYLSPGPVWIYHRFLERGNTLAAGNQGIWSLDSSADADPRLFVDFDASVKYRAFHGNGVSNAQSSIGGSVPTIGNAVELLALLFSDGSVQLRQSTNGAADVVAGQSGALAFAVAWSSPTLWMNGRGNATRIGWSATSRLLVGTGAGTLVQVINDARTIPA